MGTTPDTRAAYTTRSLAVLAGKLPQRLVPDVVPRSATQTDQPSCENSETVLVLLAILQGIVENTTSGDVLALSLYRAGDLCQQMGVPRETFELTIARFAEYSARVRAGNPFSF